jgi:hypothetical protein
MMDVFWQFNNTWCRAVWDGPHLRAMRRVPRRYFAAVPDAGGDGSVGGKINQPKLAGRAAPGNAVHRHWRCTRRMICVAARSPRNAVEHAPEQTPCALLT